MRMMTLSPGALHFKTLLRSQTDSSRNVIISTKRCQVQMALSCPTTIPVEFSTLEISSGTAIPYYQSIKRSKLPARTTKPPFDRASGLRLVVAIKALGGVFLQGLTGRLRAAPTLPCWMPGSACTRPQLAACSMLTNAARVVHGTTVYISISNFFAHLSSLWDCRRNVTRACREETPGELSAAC